MKGVEVDLQLKEGARPRFFKARSVAYTLKGGIEMELDRLVRQGVYRPISHSDWAAPIVPVRKSDGTIRICGDYKLTVNPAAECDTYPVPKTEDLFATLNGGEKFTKLDLRQAYQQLLLSEQSQMYCAVNTHRGLFQPTRLQFGIHSAAGIFQRELEKRLTAVPSTVVRVDDILITGRNDEEHLANLGMVLEVLKNNGLRLRRDKCLFLSPEVVYLGFRISKRGIETVQEKIRPVLEAPEPKDPTQLKSFLGMLQYYHRHLPNLSMVLEPLHLLLRQNQEWVWGPKQADAFKLAKERLAGSELLVHYDPTKPLFLAVDASPYGVGAVLSNQIGSSEKPVAYASRTLNQAERNYSQTEREGLAMVWGVKKFHQYLLGLKFTIHTDHKPLLGIFGESKPIPTHSALRIQRWALTMSGYNYELLYRSGAQNGNADGMSRLPLSDNPEEESQLQNFVHMVDLVHAPVKAEEVRRETERDATLVRVKEFILEGWPDELTADEAFQPYKKRSDELTIEEGVILWGGRVVVPPKLRSQVLKELHMGHVGMRRMKMLARSYCWWPSMDEQIENEVATCDACIEHAQNPPSAILHPWESASRPWSRIHVDHAGPFLGRTFLVVIDSHSKWVDVYEVPSTAAEHTIEKLRQSFAIQGLPDSIVSDNGTCFTSQEFKNFVKVNGVRHTTSAPYHPSSNGAAERTVRSFKQTLKKLLVTSKDPISTQLSRLLFAFRHTPTSTNGVSPAEIMFKVKPRTRLSGMKPELSSSWRKAADKMIESRPGARNREFAVGDRVMARSYRQGQKWVDGIILERTGPLSYKIKVDGGSVRRHVDQVRKDARAFVSKDQWSGVDADLGASVDEHQLPTEESVIPPLVEDQSESLAGVGAPLVMTPEVVESSLDSSVPEVEAPAESAPATSTVDQRYPQRSRQPPKRLRDYVC